MYTREVIGEKIRRIRVQKGLTQENLAEKLCSIQNSGKGGNPQTISRIENAVNDFGIDTFLAVAKALEVSPESLLSDDYMEQRKLVSYMEERTSEQNEKRFNCLMDKLNQLLQTVQKL